MQRKQPLMNYIEYNLIRSLQDFALLIIEKLLKYCIDLKIVTS